jgi:surface antigen
MAIVVSLPFLAVVSMGSEVLSFLAGTSSAEAAETQGFYMGGAVEGNTYAWGNCTYWAFAMRLWSGYPIPTTWGNANTWDDYARLDGYVVNHTPAVGAVYQSDAGYYGHVAYVIAVDDKTGKWTISEMNNVGLNMVNTRTFAKESAAYYNFIHDKKGGSTWKPYPIPLPSQYTGTTSQQPQ